MLDRRHSFAASKMVIAASSNLMNPYADGSKVENRIKRMKMSGYFRRPRPQNLNRRYTSTAQTLQEYDKLNADLEDLTAPVVKLRLDCKGKKND